jgi:hypothetical protein
VLVRCDGFDGNLDTTGTVNGTAFFDKSDEPVKFIARGRISETLTNSVTGKTLVNSAVFQDFFRRIDGTDEFTHSVTGFDFHVKVAGRGPLVFRDVGRKVFDTETGEIVFRAGQTKSPRRPRGRGGVLCRALVAHCRTCGWRRPMAAPTPPARVAPAG